jgi:electron transport complex protein RnfG
VTGKPLSRAAAVAGLVALAAVVAAVLAGLDRLTADKIAFNDAERVRRSLADVLPDAGSFDNAPQVDVVSLPSSAELGIDDALPIWRARRAGQPVAAVMTLVTPAGYVDRIRLIVGVTQDGQIIGVRAVQHNETPGLGDAIETSKSDWILGFAGRYLEDGTRWALRREGGDIDAMTGATITSRAVVNAVATGLAWFDDNRERVFAANSPPVNNDSNR